MQLGANKMARPLHGAWSKGRSSEARLSGSSIHLEEQAASRPEGEGVRPGSNLEAGG